MHLLPGAKSTSIVEHRISAVHWMALVKGGVDLASVYLHSGEGPSEMNSDLLDVLGDQLVRLNRPFIIGGDWQMTAEELESLGWVQRI